MIYERSVTGIQIDPYDESAVYSPHKIQIIGETDEVIGIEQILKEKRILLHFLSGCVYFLTFDTLPVSKMGKV